MYPPILPRPLLLWTAYTANDIGFRSTCPWCNTPMGHRRGPEDDDITTHSWHGCLLCGWFGRRYIYLSKITGLLVGIYARAYLRALPTGLQISLGPIEEELNRRSHHWTAAAWRHLPELLEPTLPPHGLALRSARLTRNGDAYLLLLAAGSEDALVACRQDATGAAAFSQLGALVGVSIDWTGRTGRIFLASTTDDVTKLSFPPRADTGFEFGLADACELLTRAGAYNTDLPPLDQLDEAARDEIIRTNQRGIG